MRTLIDEPEPSSISWALGPAMAAMSVALADGPFGRPIARVGHIGAHGPLPQIADHLLQARARGGPGLIAAEVGQIAGDAGGGALPLRLSGQPHARPAGESVGLEVAEMADRLAQGHP